MIHLLYTKMRLLLLAVLFGNLIIPAQGALQTKAQADSAYAKKNYRLAAESYERLLKGGVDPEICYNLGNAYFRQNDLPRAILYYEKALKYDPSNDDARYNLDVCHSKLSIPREQAAGMFFVTWTDSFIRSLSVDTWGGVALAAFVIILIGFLCVRLITQRTWRKTVISLTLTGFVVTAFGMTAAAIQYNRFNNENRAVAMRDMQLTVDDAKATRRLLVAGTTVTVIDRNPNGQVLVETSAGSLRGWTDGKALASI